MKKRILALRWRLYYWQDCSPQSLRQRRTLELSHFGASAFRTEYADPSIWTPSQHFGDLNEGYGYHLATDYGKVNPQDIVAVYEGTVVFSGNSNSGNG